MEVVSTITSPVFSDLVLVYAGHEVTHFPLGSRLFKTLRKVNDIRPFRLAFLLEVPGSLQGKARRELARTLDSAAVEGHLDFLNSPPTIRNTRLLRQEWDIPFADFD